jgi:hypothetical protein
MDPEDLSLGAMSVHCPVGAFDDLVASLHALDKDAPGSVDRAAVLAAQYDRCIGDLTPYQRAMVRVAARASESVATRRIAARAGFRSIARAVVKIHDKTNVKKKAPRTLKKRWTRYG